MGQYPPTAALARQWLASVVRLRRLLTEPGLRPVHRAMLATGAMSYVSAPLWLLYVVLGAALWLHDSQIPLWSSRSIATLWAAHSLFVLGALTGWRLEWTSPRAKPATCPGPAPHRPGPARRTAPPARAATQPHARRSHQPRRADAFPQRTPQPAPATRRAGRGLNALDCYIFSSC